MNRNNKNGIATLKMELLSLSPKILLYHDFLSEKESTRLESISRKDILKRAENEWKNDNKTNLIHVCKLFVKDSSIFLFIFCHCTGLDKNATAKIKQKLESTLDLKMSSGIQLISYNLAAVGPDQIHHDEYKPFKNDSTLVFPDRLGSVLIYVRV
jgi:hypothetical protein